MTDDFVFTALIPKPMFFELLTLLKKAGFRKPVLERHIVALSLVIHRLYTEFKHSLLVDRHSVVPVSRWNCKLNAVFLRNHLGDDYLKIFKWLEHNGFIHRDSRYKVSRDDQRGFSKACWLSSKYRFEYYKLLLSTIGRKNGPKTDDPYIKYKVVSHTVVKRLRKVRAAQKEASKRDSIVKMAYDNLAHFHIDEQAALSTLNELVEKGELVSTEMANGKTIDPVEREMNKVRRFNGVGGSDIAMYVKHDDFGRVHTNVTQMKKEVRDLCMYCDGERVGGVDIKSSQAAFLAAILREWASVAKSPLHTPRSHFIAIEPFWRPERNAEYAEYLETELEKYSEILREGRMYEFFADEMGKMGYNIDRKTAKSNFIVMLFSRTFIDVNRNPERILTREVWKRNFPHLLDCIDSMKRRNYASLAYELQRTESSFVFETVIPRIVEQVGCHFCTVHDSVIVPASCVLQVQRIMDEELVKCGIPTLTKAEGHVVYPDDFQKAEMERIEKVIAESSRNETLFN